jgi:hypothetical protein
VLGTAHLEAQCQSTSKKSTVYVGSGVKKSGGRKLNSDSDLKSDSSAYSDRDSPISGKISAETLLTLESHRKRRFSKNKHNSKPTERRYAFAESTKRDSNLKRLVPETIRNQTDISLACVMTTIIHT